MPEQREVPQTQHLDLDSQPFKFSGDEWSREYALNVVQQLFPVAENFRSISHDNRWVTNDGLFTGWKEPKVWEGTNVPRASLGMPIVFDQISSALPAIYNAIFGIGPEWFQVESEPGTDPREARAIQASMSYILEHSRDNFSTSAKTELKLAFLDMCLKGNGGVELGWDYNMRRPFIRWVDIRDFYIDPGTPVPDCEESRFIFRRKLMTVDQLQQFRDVQGFDIPPDEILQGLAKNPISVFADQGRRAQEAFRSVSFQPGSTDWIMTPQDRKIEVLMYHSKNRIVWCLNRVWVCYNAPNPYGFYPFCFAPCYIFPSRFYAMSMADVQEGNQRYIEGLMNGRLDEVSMMLHPPRVVKRGVLMTPSQQRWNPGAVYQADDAQKDFQLLQPQNALQNVYTEIQYLEQQAEKRTGINAMSQGIPRGGNVNRTATGVNTQMQGANNRLQDLVANVEDYLIVPMLYKLYKLIQYHTQPNDQLPAMTQFGSFAKVPAFVFQKPIKFRMSAASRMISKQTLQQMLPFISQYLLNGQMIGAINGIGKTVDFNEYLQLMQDASGISRLYTLVRDLTDDEKKQMQQQQQQSQQSNKDNMDYQARMAAIQSNEKVGHEKNQVEQMKVQASQPNPQIEQQKMQMQQQSDQAKMNMQMQIEQMKGQLQEKQAQMDMMLDMMKAKAEIGQKMQMAKIEQEAQKQSNFMDIQKQGADLHMKQQDNGIKLQQMMLEHSANMSQSKQEMDLQREQGQLDMSQQQAQHEQSLQQGSQNHSQKLTHEKASGDQKLKLAKAQQTMTQQKHPTNGTKNKKAK